jgi:hypothetical protein
MCQPAPIQLWTMTQSPEMVNLYTYTILSSLLIKLICYLSILCYTFTTESDSSLSMNCWRVPSDQAVSYPRFRWLVLRVPFKKRNRTRSFAGSLSEDSWWHHQVTRDFWQIKILMTLSAHNWETRWLCDGLNATAIAEGMAEQSSSFPSTFFITHPLHP